jgi:hypothetical protein
VRYYTESSQSSLRFSLDDFRYLILYKYLVDTREAVLFRK